MSGLQIERWSFLRKLLPYLARYKFRLAVGFLCILLTNLFFLGMPLVVGYAVDDLNRAATREKFAFYAAMIVLLAVFEGLFRFAMRWLLIGVSRDGEYELRNDLFRRLESLSMSFYQRNKTGELMSRATNDLSNVRMLLGPGIMYTANTVITATLAMALMFRISWSLSVLALLPLPLVSYSVRHFGRKIHRLTEESQARLADLSARRPGKHGGHPSRKGIRPGRP
jgi:ATP-binding cassette subfamily B protein